MIIYDVSEFAGSAQKHLLLLLLGCRSFIILAESNFIDEITPLVPGARNSGHNSFSFGKREGRAQSLLVAERTRKQHHGPVALEAEEKTLRDDDETRCEGIRSSASK